MNGPLSVALSNDDVPRLLAPRLLENLLASLARAFERQNLSDAGGWTKRALRPDREIGERRNDRLRLRDDGQLHERHRSADRPPPPPSPEDCHSCLVELQPRRGGVEEILACTWLTTITTNHVVVIPR